MHTQKVHTKSTHTEGAQAEEESSNGTVCMQRVRRSGGAHMHAFGARAKDVRQRTVCSIQQSLHDAHGTCRRRPGDLVCVCVCVCLGRAGDIWVIDRWRTAGEGTGKLLAQST